LDGALVSTGAVAWMQQESNKPPALLCMPAARNQATCWPHATLFAPTQEQAGLVAASQSISEAGQHQCEEVKQKVTPAGQCMVLPLTASVSWQYPARISSPHPQPTLRLFAGVPYGLRLTSASLAARWASFAQHC
jgi:hypothetical protein